MPGKITVFWTIVFLALGILSCSLINSPGTVDVHTWIRWLQDYIDYGPFTGYSHNKTDYPPLMIFIFYLFAKPLSFIHIQSFLAIKITILFFLLASTLLIFYWTRSRALTAFFYLVFILNAMALGYADVILAFFLLLTFLQLKNNNIFLAALIFSIAIFIKWQALLISPFLFLYALHARNYQASSIKKIVQIFISFVIVASLVIAGFGYQQLVAAFAWAFTHPWLSGYALNIHWALSYFYEVFHPEIFGGLRNGEITYIAATTTPLVFAACKGFFILAFAYTICIFYKSKRSMEDLLAFSLLGYLMYFTFNTGVHENHLFLAVLLSVLLVAQNKNYLPLAIYIAAAFNLNIFLFYGFNGRSGPPRVFGGLDITLVFAIINTLVFTRAWFSYTVNRRHTTGAAGTV